MRDRDRAGGRAGGWGLHQARRGFASIIAIGLFAIVATVLTALVVLTHTDAKRSEREGTDAQHNVRKLGKAGMQNLTGSLRGGSLGGLLGNTSRRWRERWHRDENG